MCWCWTLGELTERSCPAGEGQGDDLPQRFLRGGEYSRVFHSRTKTSYLWPEFYCAMHEMELIFLITICVMPPSVLMSHLCIHTCTCVCKLVCQVSLWHVHISTSFCASILLLTLYILVYVHCVYIPALCCL